MKSGAWPLAPGEIRRADTTALLPADYHFNPSLARRGEDVWMVYRRVTRVGADIVSWPRKLALCRLDSSLQPIGDSNIDLSARIKDPPRAQPWHADARFFDRHDGSLGLWYHDNYNPYLMRVDPAARDGVLMPRKLALRGRKPRERERNWGIFDDGVLRAVYSIDPHVIVRLDDCDSEFEAHAVHETTVDIPWDAATLGEPHGGTSPVRVGGHWFSFFQSSVLAAPGSEQKIYRVGFYGFDARPPYRIRFMTKLPIIDGSDLAPPLSFWMDYKVAYPSGALHEDGRWLVSLGIHDRAIGFASFRHDDLLAQCVAL